MAATIRNSTSGTDTSAVVSVTLPTHAADDLLVVVISIDGGAKPIGASNGFVVKSCTPSDYDNDQQIYLLHKKATSASETLTITLASSKGSAWIALAVQDVEWTNITHGIVDLDFQDEQGNTRGVHAFSPAPYQIYDEALLVTFWGHNGVDNTATPSLNGWTQIANVDGSRSRLFGAYKASSTRGSVAAPTITTSTPVYSYFFCLHILGTGVGAPITPKIRPFGSTGADQPHINFPEAAVAFRHATRDSVLLGVWGASIAGSTLAVTQPAQWAANDVCYGAATGDMHMIHVPLDSDSVSTTLFNVGQTACYGKCGAFLRGANSEKPFARFQWNGFVPTTNSTSHTPPVLTTTETNQLHVVFIAADGGTVSGTLSGYTVTSGVGIGTPSAAYYLASKEYASQGEDTSLTATSLDSSKYQSWSLLVASERNSQWPAYVRASGHVWQSGAVTSSFRNIHHDAGDFIVFMDSCSDFASLELDVNPSVAGVSSWVEKYREFNVANQYNAHIQVGVATAAGEQIDYTIANDPGSNFFLSAMVVTGGHQDVITADSDTLSGTGNLALSLKAPLGCVAGLVLQNAASIYATSGSCTPAYNLQNSGDYYQVLIDCSPPAQFTDTINVGSGTTSYAGMLAFPAPPTGNAGLLSSDF